MKGWAEAGAPTATVASCVHCGDGVAARRARQFGLLERLGAVTVVLAETLGAEATKYPGSSAAEAFVQVARSLRQTVALEMRLDAEREAQARRDAEAHDSGKRRDLGKRREAAAPVKPAVVAAPVADAAADGAADAAQKGATAADAAAKDDATPTPREDLLRDLRERPDWREAVDELRGRPSGEVVARICQMLGIEADLRCFTDQEMGRLAALNHPQPPQPPAKLSDAAFEAALARPSHGPPGLRPAISPNARLQAIEAAAIEAAAGLAAAGLAAAGAACAGGGHDPPYAVP